MQLRRKVIKLEVRHFQVAASWSVKGLPSGNGSIFPDEYHSWSDAKKQVWLSNNDRMTRDEMIDMTVSFAGAMKGPKSASGGKLASSASRSFWRSRDDLSAAAAAPGRGELTAAGHQLTKHAAGQRAGSGAFPALRGGSAQINEIAEFQVNDILTAPGSKFTQRTHHNFGKVLDVTAPDGRGLRFDSEGRFVGFLEPPR